MTSEDSPDDATDDVSEGEPAETTTEPSVDDAEPGDTPEGRTQRPLLAGAIGLVAGIAGGIAGTTIAPDSLILTIVLVVGVAGVVTLGTLRLLARRE